MAALTLSSTLVPLGTAYDGTPAAPLNYNFVSDLLYKYDKNNMSGAARMYIPADINNISWSSSEQLIAKFAEYTPGDYEEKKTLVTSITRRGRRRPRGILYPRGSYVPYRRRLR